MPINAMNISLLLSISLSWPWTFDFVGVLEARGLRWPACEFPVLPDSFGKGLWIPRDLVTLDDSPTPSDLSFSGRFSENSSSPGEAGKLPGICDLRRCWCRESLNDDDMSKKE
jgi:hypothetical protein